MAKSGAERMQELRERQKQGGQVAVTLTVPASDRRYFQEMALLACDRERSRRRERYNSPRLPPERSNANQEKLVFRWALQSGLKARIPREGAKLGELLAMNIAVEILELGFPIGRRLGSEEELIQRYGVGRSIVREAVRILEHQTVAVMTKGPSGGLIVAEPQRSSAAYLSGLYLEYCGVTGAQILDVRRVVTLGAMEFAMARLDEDGERLIRQYLEEQGQQGARDVSLKRLHQFDMLLARLSGNPIVELFMDILLRESRFHNRSKKLLSAPLADFHKAVEAHRRIGLAMLSRDVTHAKRDILNHLATVANWLTADH